MGVYRYRNAVMFQHCDPAGIVFYPRYFEMMNTVIETFFDIEVGWSFHRMHAIDRAGVPMGRVLTDFHAASRLGDVLDWTLTVMRIGGASLDLKIHASCGGDERLSATSTLVLVDLDRMASMRWPDDRRARIECYMEDAT